MSEKVVLITGGNAGIGLALAERLLAADQSIHLCLACRNPSKARAAKDALLVSHPGCTIELLQLDVSDLQSVYNAAKEIKKRYSHIEYMYFNAGIMPNPTVNWKQFFKGLFSTNAAHMFSTGEGLLMQKDSTTQDGLQNVFATNVFGHFVLLKELTEMLSRQSSTARVVWTSSSNAKKDAFSLDDVQHHEGFEPYASSKYAVNLLSIALNNVLNEKGIYSHLTNPGLVVSNMTNNIMPNWFWSLITPLLYLFRLLSANFTLSPYNGAESLFWMFSENAERADSESIYHSRTSICGNNYVLPEKIKFDDHVPSQFYKKLVAMEGSYKSKYKT